MEVKNLFYKCPVRRKSASIVQEMEEIKQRVEGVILSHHWIAVTLYDKNKGRVLQNKKANSLLV